MKKIFLIITSIFLAHIVFAQQLPVFKVKGERTIGLNTAQRVKMQQALALFEKVMNDTAFQTAVRTYHFQYDKPDDPNRNLSPEQVAQKLYGGTEWYFPAIDNTANVYWELKKKPWLKPKITIGYGMPQDTVIFTYTWYFDEDDNLPELAGHIAHEWSHKVGFDHTLEDHPGREETVPYAFGNLVAQFAAKYVPHGPVMMVAKTYRIPCNSAKPSSAERRYR